MRIKLNTMVKVITVSGDELIGKYRGVDMTGIILKDASIFFEDENRQLNMVSVYIEFNKVNEIIPQRGLN